MSTVTDTPPCVMLPGTSNLGIQTTIASTPSLTGVNSVVTSESEASQTGSFSKFFSANGMLSIFGRGFLAEPVLRDETESYRYLMALDRF